jgi:hypothetical protein
MFDPFKQSKFQSSYSRLKDVKIPERDMSLDDLKRLSGVDKASKDAAVATQLNKAQYMRENNIKPGIQEWFKLWFAKPELTKENPFK